MSTIIYAVTMGVAGAFIVGLISRLTDSKEQKRERRDLNEAAKDMLVAMRKRERR